MERYQMKKSLLVRLILLCLTSTALAGCILVPVDDGYRGGGYYERGHGGRHGGRHGDYDDRR